MKVVQVNAIYGQKSTGTIVRDIEHLCHSSNIQCFVAGPDKEVLNAKYGYRIGNIVDHKLHAFLSRINGLQAYFSFFATIHFLRYLNKIKPDVVHLHNLHNNYINLNLLAKYLAKHDIATVITLHDCWFFTGGCSHYTSVGCCEWMNKCGKCPANANIIPSFFKYRSDKVIYDRRKYLSAIPRLYIVGVSDWITNECKKANIQYKQALTIHNGLDISVYRPTESNLRHKLGLEHKFVLLGPAIKWLLPINKSVFELFTSKLKSDELLLLFGAADTTLAVPNNVMLLGYINNPREMAELYSCADVFVNTTREDSFSLINIEAQACGTPAVTFDQTGPKDTVDGINSFCVKVGDAELMYSVVENIRRSIVDKCAIRQFVLDNFESNHTYKSYISLYQRICRNC